MKIKKQQLIQLALGLVVGAVCGYAGMQFSKGMGDFAPMDGPVQKRRLSPSLFFAIWFALAFHELAHLVTGLGQGFRFQLYVAGFLGIRRDPETERVTPYWNTDMQLFGGVAATLPQEDSPDLIKRFARVVIAGPLGSLALAAGGGLAGWALSHTAGVGLRLLAAFFIVSAITSFFLFLATTVPGRTGMFFTDRARYFRLRSGGKTADIERAMLGLVAQAHSGKSLAELNMADVEVVRQDKDYAVYADLYAFSHYLATDQPDMAVQVAERLHELPDEMPALFRAELWKEVCFAAAYLKNDAAAANAWWQKIEKQLAKRHDVSALRVKSALSRVNGEPVEATHLARTALALLDKKPVLNAGELLERQLLYTLV
ncbi:MAG: hypothetical protein IPM98_09965 [Lewinellaceae bacterium]|nr:hypothetical protein [Lewinellaceae bacterium]